MNNPREKWDILWELMEASALLGKEAERLPTQPTIENFQKAFRWRQEVLARAMDRLETKKEEEHDGNTVS